MNIHFEDKKLYDLLKKKTIITAPIGSRFYGDHNKDSDYDYLNIYVPDIIELSTPFSNHHQLQYKTEKGGKQIDENFTSISQFFRNLSSGDSTVNFEVLFTKEFKAVFPELDYKKFYLYNTVKAYLGFAKRDLAKLRSGDETKERHILRSLNIARFILDGRSIEKFVYENKWAARLMVVEDYMRKELNEKLERKEIKRFLSTDMQIKISEKVSDIIGKKYNDYILQNALKLTFETNENPYLIYKK